MLDRNNYNVKKRGYFVMSDQVCLRFHREAKAKGEDFSDVPPPGYEEIDFFNSSFGFCLDDKAAKPINVDGKSIRLPTLVADVYSVVFQRNKALGIGLARRVKQIMKFAEYCDTFAEDFTPDIEHLLALHKSFLECSFFGSGVKIEFEIAGLKDPFIKIHLQTTW